MVVPPQGHKTIIDSSLKSREDLGRSYALGPDPLSQHYASRLEGGYDCVDRPTINAYVPYAQTPGLSHLVARPQRLGRQP